MARGVGAVSHDAGDLTSGFWVVVVTFEGELTAVRMDDDPGELRRWAWSPLSSSGCSCRQA